MLIALLLTVAMDAGVMDAAVQPAVSATSAMMSSSSSAADAGAMMPGMSVELPELTDEQVPALIQELTKALSNRDYEAAAAGLLMLTVWLLRKLLLDRMLLDRLAKLMPDMNANDLIPWITLAIAMCTGWMVGLKANLPLGQTIMSGVLIGLAASGGWSLVGKHVVKRLARKPKEVPAPVPEVKEPVKSEPKE